MTESPFMSSSNGYDDGVTMRDDRRVILAFLLVMLTSVLAGWRQCQVMQSNERPPLRPLQEVMEEFRAKYPTNKGTNKGRIKGSRVFSPLRSDP
jgi:hypothetical protein